MLSNSPVYATIGVKNLNTARDFYENTLGLGSSSQQEIYGGVMYDCADTKIFVYESQFGGTNQATSASWMVEDIESEVSDLKNKGVTFEHYDFPDTTLEGDIHVMEGMKAVWFKDPDGNILNVVAT